MALISKTYFTMRNPLFIRAPLERRARHAGTELFPHSRDSHHFPSKPQSSLNARIS
jgi:hypothetical protein